MSKNRKRFWNDQRGAIAVMTGLCGAVLVGFAALAIDVGSWQVARRSMQGAADAAAYSAGIAAYRKHDGTSYVTQAKAITAAAGYVDGQNRVTVSVNKPPTSGGYTGSPSAIEVVIQQPQPRFLAGLFLPSDPTVTARAVATMAGSACILALDPTANQAITVNGSANVNSPGCDIAANSNSASAINMSGSSSITASCLVAVGNVETTSSLALTECTSPATGAAPTLDPYESVPTPTPSGACLTVPNKSTMTLYPGHYCSGIHISGSQSATFQAGVYYVSGGNFQIDGTANGTGVTFFIGAPKTASIAGGSTSSFTAPTSGTYSGIVFFGDRSGTTSSNNQFSGGSNLTITGAIYFPTQSVAFSGGSASGANCTQLIGKKITVTGNAYFNDACDGSGMEKIITPTSLQLVE